MWDSFPESKTFKSLLGPQEPAVWYEAAEQLPDLSAEGSAETVTDEVVALKKSTAEEQLQRETKSFEKQMKREYRDAAYLQKVLV